MGGCALVSFRWFFLVVGGFGWLWAFLANFRWLWEILGYFDNSGQSWKVLGGFGCL